MGVVLVKRKNSASSSAPSASPSTQSSQEAVPRRRNGGGQRPGFSNVQLGIMFGLLLVGNYYGMTWFQHWRKQNDSKNAPTANTAMYQVSGAVTVRQLVSPNAKFAEECSKSSVPVVLRNPVVEKWRARRHWTPKYLQSQMSYISGVYQNDNRWFGPYYDLHKPLTNLSTRTNNYTTNITMTSKNFKILRNPSHFTGDIDQLGEWSVGDIQPRVFMSCFVLCIPRV